MQRKNLANPMREDPPLFQPRAQNPGAARNLLAHSPPPFDPHPAASSSSNEYQRFTSPPNAAAAPVTQQQPATYNAYPANTYNAQSPPGQPPKDQQQQQTPWNAFASGGQQPAWANDATTQMGMQFGRHAVAAGSEYVERNFTRHLPITHLQHSFNVSNLYVLRKVRIVLFPWRHKPWSRLVKRSEQSGQAEGYRPPREDINSPDLYIPLMALVTYILLSGIVAGAQSRFGPELLGKAASRSLGIVFLEFLVIRLGTYLLNIGGEGTIVDLFSYSGYKFVGIIVTLLANLLKLEGWKYWAVFAYVFLANFFFLLRSLRYVVLPDPALAASLNPSSTSTAVTHTTKQRRILFLFCIAGAQSMTMLFLAQV